MADSFQIDSNAFPISGTLRRFFVNMPFFRHIIIRIYFSAVSRYTLKTLYLL